MTFQPGHPGKPTGAIHLKPEEVEDIKLCLERHAIRYRNKQLPNLRALYEVVGDELGYPWQTVARAHRMTRSTTKLATDLIKARAFRMASRMIRKAKPELIADILSRPNIGVLEPIKKVEGGGPGGFFMSMTMDSLGAANVQIASTPLPQTPTPQALPSALEDIDAEIIGDEERSDEEPIQIETRLPKPVQQQMAMERGHQLKREGLKPGPGHSPTFQRAVEAAKKRLEEKAARKRERGAARRGEEPT